MLNNEVKSFNKISRILYSSLLNLKECLNPITIDQFVISILETLMTLEREEYLQSIKDVHNGDSDKGNGAYKRSFKSLSRNSLIINIPRTRSGNFKPFVLEFLKYNQEQINDLVLALYKKGLTTRDVSEILKDFFGEEISYSQVSNLAEKFNDLRKSWEISKLESYYKVIFCDCVYITLRRDDSYSKEAVHIIYGVRDDNKRELLSLSVNPTESSKSWAECFSKIKDRGIEDVGLVVADGLKHLENEVHKYFKTAKFQKCAVHKMRNILNKSRPKDKKEIAKDLSEIFDNFTQASSKKEALQKIKNFICKWKDKYEKISSFFENDELEYYFTYIDFHPNVRRMIYTTNSIESLNKKIRKATKNKQSFEKEDRLLDYLFVVIKDFENSNWMKYPVSLYAGF